MKNTLAFLLLLLAYSTAKSQGNDNFSGAIPIVISDNNYAFENISSTKSDLSNATIEGSEFIASLATNQALNDKSVWYYFYIPTARSVAITVKQQDTLIAQNHIGLSVYRNPKSIPNASKLDNTLPTITKFGSTRNVCTQPGYYYIQVVANSAANAHIWLELSIAPPENTICDLASKPHEFGIVDGIAAKYIEFGCYSIDQDDEKLNDTTLTQSAWFTYTTANNPDFFDFLSPAKNLFLYEGDCKKGVSGLTALLSNAEDFENYCDLKPNKTYSICIRFPFNFRQPRNVVIHCRGFGDPIAADPDNLDPKFTLGKINSANGYFSFREEEIFDCKSAPTNYNCSGLTPQNDTDKLHCLLTFETDKPATIRPRLRLYSNINMRDQIWASHRFKLYKGNVSKDCNVEYLRDLNDVSCLDPGTYTLQVVIDKYIGSTYRSAVGTIGGISLYINFLENQKSIIHRSPGQAEFIGKFGNKDSINSPSVLLSEIDYYAANDTFLLLDSSIYYGRFVFREFYLTSKEYLAITEKFSSNSFKSYLFKGSVSRNKGKVDLVKLKYGSPIPFGYRFSDSSFVSKCKKLEKGWYSIMTVTEEHCIDETNLLQNQIKIEYDNRIKSKFNHPYKAHMVNNLEPIGFKSNYGTANAPKYKNTISLPTEYFDCPLDTPTYITHTCYSNYKIDQIAYYVFNVKEESFLETTPGLLYPYNVKTDSLKLLDSINMISPCKTITFDTDYNYYCKIQPGVYTLVISRWAGNTISPSISLSPIKYLPSNHAKQAYDLGHLKNGITQSKGEFISCSVNESSTDYPYQNSSRRTLKNPQKHNQYIEHYSYGNVWYTFTATNAGKVAIWFNQRQKPV
ncbi:MAG: hypothetical protein ACPGLV_09070, partial [Bacteroidia bacterium]